MHHESERIGGANLAELLCGGVCREIPTLHRLLRRLERSQHGGGRRDLPVLRVALATRSTCSRCSLYSVSAVTNFKRLAWCASAAISSRPRSGASASAAAGLLRLPGGATTAPRGCRPPATRCIAEGGSRSGVR